MTRIRKIKKKYLQGVRKALGKNAFGLDARLANYDKKYNVINLFNTKKEYVQTVSPKKLGVEYEELVEQNDMGIGRPALKQFKIKRNRVKFSITSMEEPGWYLLPFISVGILKQFLQNIDAQCDLIDTVSKVVRGETVSVLIPENRIPYLKEIVSKGAEANPYHDGKI